jgi:hypothetical protein
MSDDVVEWHTWSGTRHKFGPAYSFEGFYRDALCNTSIVADVSAQKHRPERRRCKRCFPVSDSAEIDALAALIREVDGNHDLGAGALAEALHARGVRCSS